MKKKLRSVLLIDDNVLTNKLSVNIITKLDITEQIAVAENGQLGLDYLTKKGKFSSADHVTPDLILLDINMPVMDGWEFLQEYKKLPPQQKCRILVIMLTTSPNPDDEKNAREMKEVSDFIRKPLSKEVVMHIIEKHFPGYL